MKIKDLIRTAVLRTNTRWPFSQLNKTPYYIAIRAFVGLCRKFPQIRSVYLRHGIVEGNWVPAISDIDITLIIDSKLSIDDEFSFLNRFWGNYEGMKKLFPMLGEVEILNEEHIRSWSKFGIQGYESNKWRLVCGKETVKSNYIPYPGRLARDYLDYALTYYLGYFLRKFKQEEPAYLVSQDLKRLTSKILRYISCIGSDATNSQNAAGRLDDKSDMLNCALAELEKGLSFIIPSDNEADTRKKDIELLTDVDCSNNEHFENQPFDLKTLTSQNKAIASIILDYHKRVFIVLKDGLDDLTMKSCIDTIRCVFSQEDKMPMIATSRLFKYILRSYNPFEYSSLMRYRTVVYGRDLLSDIRPPEKHIFVRKIVEQTTNILTFPQSYKLILPPSTDWFLARELESTVERFFSLKLYLEKGVIGTYNDGLLTESERYYPDDYKKMRELQESTGQFSNEMLSREWFRLLKSMANDVHNCVTNSNVTESLFQPDLCE